MVLQFSTPLFPHGVVFVRRFVVYTFTLIQARSASEWIQSRKTLTCASGLYFLGERPWWGQVKNLPLLLLTQLLQVTTLIRLSLQIN